MGIIDLFRGRKKVSLPQEPETDRSADSFPHTEKSWETQKGSNSLPFSISVSLSRVSVQEDGVEDLYAGGDSLSNEQIAKGDRILDTYLVTSDAIKGGMGSIWKVHHSSWDTDLAMKRPQPRFFSEASAERKQHFIHECEAWIGLGLHPNIVSCYYVREIGGVPTIFSEWMENGSLKNRIDDRTLYAASGEELQPRLLDIAIQSARGLHYAHETGEGLIHQDVKPDNLLLTNDWGVKVADFGLARARTHLFSGSAAGMGRTITGGDEDGLPEEATHMAPTGGYTPAYCSPEQLSGKELTRRTDLYSWALSVLEMYLGGRLWKNGADAGKNCKEYFRQCYVPLPDPLADLLAECLGEQTKDRPHDFAAVLGKLESIYKTVCGYPYPRQEPKASADTADSLNNRGISMIDLGKWDKAGELLDLACEKDPSHMYANLNRRLFQWNTGMISGDVLMENVRKAEIPKQEKKLIMEMVRRSEGKVEDIPLPENFFRGWIILSPGGNVLCRQRSEGQEVILLHLPDGKEIGRFLPEKIPGDGSKYLLVQGCSDDGKYLYLNNTTTANEILICDMERGEICARIKPWKDLSKQILHFVLSEDGSYAVVDLSARGEMYSEILVINAKNGRVIGEHRSFPQCKGIVALSPDTGFILSGTGYTSGKKVRTISRLSPNMKKVYWEDSSYNGGPLVVTPDKKAVCLLNERGFFFFDLESGKLLGDVLLDFEDKSAQSYIGFLNQGNYLACASRTRVFVSDFPGFRNIRMIKDFGGEDSGIWVSELKDCIWYMDISDHWRCGRYNPGETVTTQPYMLVRAVSTVKASEDERLFREKLSEAEDQLAGGNIPDALESIESAFTSIYRDKKMLEELNDRIGTKASLAGIRYLYMICEYAGERIPTTDPEVFLGNTSDILLHCPDGTIRISMEQACRLIPGAGQTAPYVSRKGPVTGRAMMKEVKEKKRYSIFDEARNYVYDFEVVDNAAGYAAELEKGKLSRIKCPSGFAVSFYDTVFLCENGKGTYAAYRQTEWQNKQIKGELQLLRGNGGMLKRQLVMTLDGLEYHPGESRIRFSPGGGRLFVSGKNKDNKTWEIDTATGEIIREYTGLFPVFSRDGYLLALIDGSRDGCFFVYDCETGKQMHTGILENDVYTLAFADDGRFLLALCDTCSVWLYDMKTGKALEILISSNAGKVSDFCLSDDRRFLVVRNYLNEYRIYRIVWKYEMKE